MKALAFLIFTIGLRALAADAPKASQTKPTSKLNSQIYEKESEETSFEDKVKVIREVQGETEVFFEKTPGFYVLAKADFQELLIQSQKKHTPVRVSVNTSNRQILKVEAGSQD